MMMMLQRAHNWDPDYSLVGRKRILGGRSGASHKFCSGDQGDTTTDADHSDRLHGGRRPRGQWHGAKHRTT